MSCCPASFLFVLLVFFLYTKLNSEKRERERSQAGVRVVWALQFQVVTACLSCLVLCRREGRHTQCSCKASKQARPPRPPSQNQHVSHFSLWWSLMVALWGSPPTPRQDNPWLCSLSPPPSLSLSHIHSPHLHEKNTPSQTLSSVKLIVS